MSRANVTLTPEVPLARRPFILAACMAATFMAAVEATIVATAMPTITASLGHFGLFAWAFSAYMLGQAATIPIYGRLADMYGRRRLFYVGTGLFLLGCTLCGFSRTMLQLILFRAVQGLGAGGVQPIANTIVGDIYAPVERARVQGLLSGVFGIAAIIGPTIGTFVLQIGDWPLVFWINLPIGVAAIVMIAVCLPEHSGSRHLQVDFIGSALLILTVTAIMLLALQVAALELQTIAVIVTVILFAGVGLVLHERSMAEPMLPLDLWRNRVILSSNIGSLFTGILMMGVIAYLPTYVQGEMGHGPGASATILAVMMVVWVLGSTTAGLYLPRASYRSVATFGAIMLIVGADTLIDMTPASGPAWAGIGAMLIGAGLGFCNTTFIISAQTSVPWRQRGAATSSSMFLRFLGQALGAAVFAAVMNVSLRARTPDATEALDQLMSSHWRASIASNELEHVIATTATAMRHGYLLTGALAIATLFVALSYPMKLGPASQKRQQ